jgi:LmbE family N-acetylglucosaminyl deacetylase
MFRRRRGQKYRVTIRPGENWHVVKLTVRSTSRQGAKRAAIRTAKSNQMFGRASERLNETNVTVEEVKR